MGNTPSAVLMHALPCALRQTETIPERTRGDKQRINKPCQVKIPPFKLHKACFKSPPMAMIVFID